LGDNLKLVVVRHVSDARFHQHLDCMAATLKDYFDVMHSGKVLDCGVLDEVTSQQTVLERSRPWERQPLGVLGGGSSEVGILAWFSLPHSKNSHAGGT